MKIYKKYIVALGLAFMCLMLAGCGCGKKSDDPASQQVLKISITPEPSPTPEPDQIDSAAVVTNGNITMVNTYLEDNPGSSSTAQDRSTVNQTDGNSDNADTGEDTQEESSEE